MVRFLMPIGVAGIVAVTIASFTSTQEQSSGNEHVSLFEQLTSFRTPLQTPSLDDLTDRSEELSGLIPAVGGHAALVIDENGIAVCDREQGVLDCIDFASLTIEDVFEAFQFGEVAELDENSFAVPLLAENEETLAVLGDFGESVFDGASVPFAANAPGLTRGGAAGAGGSGGLPAAASAAPFGGGGSAPGGSVAGLVAAAAGGAPGLGAPVVSGAISPSANSVLSFATPDTDPDGTDPTVGPIAAVPAPMGAVLLLTGLAAFSLRKRRA